VGTKADKVHKVSPWVAIATAAIIPFFSYMESRDRARQAEVRVEDATVKQEAKTSEAKATTTAVYERTTKETDRLQLDITACHQRVDKLAQAMVEIATSRRRVTRAPAAITEQRAIERPPMARLPKRKGDVSKDDPLADALK